MTNGEVLQKTFPNSELDTLSTKIVFTLEPRTLGQQVFVFDKDWWNAEYKELTTKNETKYCGRNICLKNEYNNVGCEDCEVTNSQEPTTKNDLAQERYQDLIEYFGDEKVAKTILEDKKEFKAWLERLRWYVKKADELARELEQIKGTTKNDLGVDCISRAEAIKCLECDFDITGKENMKTVVNYINSAHDKIVNLPRVKQEPFKPMVEIDLYSVIKQKYIEREVLDKIREQIKSNLRGVEIALEVLVENHPLRPKMEGAKDTLEDCLELIDKAETEKV